LDKEKKLVCVCFLIPFVLKNILLWSCFLCFCCLFSEIWTLEC